MQASIWDLKPNHILNRWFILLVFQIKAVSLTFMALIHQQKEEGKRKKAKNQKRKRGTDLSQMELSLRESLLKSP